MSLAMFAAPFDENIETSINNSDNNIINKKNYFNISKLGYIYPFSIQHQLLAFLSEELNVHLGML
mgnify:CR=1 FL=1